MSVIDNAPQPGETSRSQGSSSCEAMNSAKSGRGRALTFWFFGTIRFPLPRKGDQHVVAPIVIEHGAVLPPIRCGGDRQLRGGKDPLADIGRPA